MSIVAVDLDGVVCNWAFAFSRLANTCVDSRCPVVEDNWCPEWDWKRWYAPELSRRKAANVIERTWRLIKESSTFWRWDVTPLFPADMAHLNEVSRAFPIVFMTRRDGIGVHKQTTEWLRIHGIKEPMVYVVKSGEEKGDLCLRMGIDWIIEDSPKYGPEILESGINLVMIEWPYNKRFREDNEYADYRKGNDFYTAKTLGDALSLVERLAYP